MNTRVHRMIMLYITGIIKHVAPTCISLIHLYGLDYDIDKPER